MKILIKIILYLVIALIVFGYILESTAKEGKLFIGIGVVLFASVFMPLFVYYRYKDKVGGFIDSRMEQPKDNSN